MEIHSSILAWKIPWMEESGRLHTVHGVRKESDKTEQLHFHFQVFVRLSNHCQVFLHLGGFLSLEFTLKNIMLAKNNF